MSEINVGSMKLADDLTMFHLDGIIYYPSMPAAARCSRNDVILKSTGTINQTHPHNTACVFTEACAVDMPGKRLAE